MRRPASETKQVLPDILHDTVWQMSPGERAAIKGILSELAPALAIEIGTGQGGSLRRIAAASQTVHAFDDSEPSGDLVAALRNVTFHTGDSHELLPRLLAQLAERRANVDFALVDGDHSPQGVKRDVEDLLASPAVGRTLIVLHDTANPAVREGLEAVDYSAFSKLTWVDLDWVPGFILREGHARGQAWGGLGVVVVDAARPRPDQAAVRAGYAFPAAGVLAAYGRTLTGSRRRGGLFRRG
jgi:Methyltransferase domain